MPRCPALLQCLREQGSTSSGLASESASTPHHSLHRSNEHEPTPARGESHALGSTPGSGQVTARSDRFASLRRAPGKRLGPRLGAAGQKVLGGERSSTRLA